MEKEIVSDKGMVAFCGLYCGACRSYLKGKCPGCAKNEKASWCSVRSCCLQHQYQSCADCKEFPNAMDCSKYNNFMSKLMGFIFRSDRNACIEMIKHVGYDAFAAEMAAKKQQTIKK